jgi:hypothetical protein
MLNRRRELGRKSYLGASQGDLCMVSTFALGLPPAEPSRNTIFLRV